MPNRGFDEEYDATGDKILQIETMLNNYLKDQRVALRYI